MKTKCNNMGHLAIVAVSGLALSCGFSGCSNDKASLFDPSEVAELIAQKTHQDFESAFVAEFGTPAPNQDWGFGSAEASVRTRAGETSEYRERTDEEILELTTSKIYAFSEDTKRIYLQQLGEQVTALSVEQLKAFGFKRIICEDLAIESGDFDYNDAVFDAKRIVDADEEGDAVFYVILRATGAHMTIHVGDSPEKGAFEVHELFGVPTKQFVNTQNKERAKVAGAYWDKDHEPVFTMVKVTPKNGKVPSLIDLNVYAEENPLPLTAEKGQPAEKLCVDVDFSWVTEKMKMRVWYPDFEHYVTGDEVLEHSWWYTTYWAGNEPNINELTGIPDDSEADPNPSISSPTTILPNIQASITSINDVPVGRLVLTGVRSSNDADFISLFGTTDANQNVWVEVDDKPKGILVYNNSENDQDVSIKTDVVFTVDNSGSMADEANAIARDIVSWATTLKNSGLDARFGCVGYGYNVGTQYAQLQSNYGVAGALNLTTLEQLSAYLNRSNGVARTYGFYGSDASTLQAKAAAGYSRSGGENGVQAIRFADENFSFRSNTYRIYVNFTDDNNYTGSSSDISIAYIANSNKWTSSKGTIHSVISSPEATIVDRANQNTWAEIPWLISEYTGGSTIFAPSDFSGVTLESLPVTGAMENSYVIQFSDVNELFDDKAHDVHITIKSEDGTVNADKTFSIVFEADF